MVDLDTSANMLKDSLSSDDDKHKVQALGYACRSILDNEEIESLFSGLVYRRLFPDYNIDQKFSFAASKVVCYSMHTHNKTLDFFVVSVIFGKNN